MRSDSADDRTLTASAAAITRGGRWPWAMTAAIVICIVVFAVTAGDFFREGTLAAKGDGRDQFLPYYTLVADFARSGQLLTWDPWSAGGLPDLAEPQTAAASPLTVLFALITGPGPRGWAIYVWAMWLLGGLGVFGLGRHLRAPGWGCFVVAMGWLGSGFYTGQLMHTPHIVSYSFLPWIVWRLDVGLTRRSWLAMLQASLLLGLAGLGGYPGLTMTTACFCLIWAAGRAWFRDSAVGAQVASAQVSGPRRVVGDGARLATFVLLAGIVLLPSYWGFMHEGKGVTSRTSSVTWDMVEQSRSVQPFALLSMGDQSLVRMLPQAIPRDIKRDPPATWNLYCGIGLLILAGVALISRPRSGWRWFILMLSVLALLTALGPALPVRRLLFDWIPLSATFRQSTFFRVYLHLGITILAILGCRDIAEGIARRRIVGICAMTILFAATFFAAHVAVQVYLRKHAIDVADDWTLPALWLLIGPAICLLAYKPRRWTTALVYALACCAIVEFVAVYAYSKGSIYALRDPATLQITRRLQATHVASVTLGTQAVDRAKTFSYHNEHLFDKTSVLSAYTALRSPFIPFVDATAAQVQEALDTYSFATSTQRFWFSDAALECPADPSIYTSLAQRKADPPLLIHPRSTMLGIGQNQGGSEYAERISAATPMQRLNCEVLEYTPTSMRLKVTTPSAGWVLVTDRWARSWKASIDGQETEVLGGNLLYRAVKVDSGTHLISMWYSLPWYYCCIAASWGTVFLVAILTFWRWATQFTCSHAEA